MKVELRKLSKAKIENYTCRKCKLEIESGSGFVKDKVMQLGEGEECEVVD